jgi:predicted choloylglycine hydrolase
MIAQDEMSNYEDFRDCVSELLISRLSGTCSNTATKRKKATKGRKNEIKPVIRGPDEEKTENESLAADLGETIEVCVGYLPVFRIERTTA